MGILNVTPDSFSDGGRYTTPEKAVARAEEMLSEGADIIDIGGESTRPGAEHISDQEELARVIPVITGLKRTFPNTTLSVDTWKSAVAEEALNAGCTIINSLGGFSFDKKLITVVAKHNATIMIYHIKGNPKTMQQTLKDTDSIQEIKTFFTEQLTLGKTHDIKKDQYILDPGIGFGKTDPQNIDIIKRLKEFQSFGVPLAIGVSRKSHLGRLMKQEINLETTPTERLEGGLAETAIAVQNGAAIIRTHDILETKKFLSVLELFL